MKKLKSPWINCIFFIVFLIVSYFKIPSKQTQDNIITAVALVLFLLFEAYIAYTLKKDKGSSKINNQIFILEWILFSPTLLVLLMYLLNYFCKITLPFHIPNHYIKIWSTIAAGSIFAIFVLIVMLPLIKSGIVKRSYDDFLKMAKDPISSLIFFFGIYAICTISNLIPNGSVPAISAIFLLIVDKDFIELRNWKEANQESGSKEAFDFKKKVFLSKLQIVLIASSITITQSISKKIGSDEKLIGLFKSQIIPNLFILSLTLFIGMILISIIEKNIVYKK